MGEAGFKVVEIYGILTMVSTVAMVFLFVLLRREFIHFNGWKDSFSLLEAAEIKRIENTANGFKSSVRDELEIYKSKILVEVKDITRNCEYCKNTLFARIESIANNVEMDAREIAELIVKNKGANERLDKFEYSVSELKKHVSLLDSND